MTKEKCQGFVVHLNSSFYYSASDWKKIFNSNQETNELNNIYAINLKNYMEATTSYKSNMQYRIFFTKFCPKVSKEIKDSEVFGNKKKFYSDNVI